MTILDVPPSVRSSSQRSASVVVGYDASAEARDALRVAAARVGPFGRLVVVYAARPTSQWLDSSFYADAVAWRKAEEREVLDELNRLDFGDVDVDVEVVDGPPAEAIVRAARHHDAVEIVVGSRGLGFLRAALGSVSQRTHRTYERRGAGRRGACEPRTQAGRRQRRRHVHRAAAHRDLTVRARRAGAGPPSQPHRRRRVRAAAGDAKRLVSGVVADPGLRPIDAGPLRRARRQRGQDDRLTALRRIGAVRRYAEAVAPGASALSASSEAFTPRGSTMTGQRASAATRRETPPRSTARTGP